MRTKQIEFSVEKQDVVFIGANSERCSGVAQIDWRVSISYNKEGIIDIEPDMNGGVSVEVMRESPEDELFVIGNEVGCQQFDDRIHSTYQNDFEVHFNLDQLTGKSNINITDMEVDFDKRKITLL